MAGAKRAVEQSPYLISSTKAEGAATRDYPARSVNREIIHQMNRKHTRKVDPSKAKLVSRSRATPSVGRERPADRNQACRDRQSWQRRTSPPIAHSTRSNAPLR